MSSDPETGLRLLREWDERRLSPDLDAVAKWAAQNPRHAAEVARECSTTAGGLKALEVVGRTWAQESLRGEARATAIGGIVERLADQDVHRTVGLVAGLDAGGTKNKAIGSLVEPWFRKEGGAPVAEWLVALPEADAREAGFNILGSKWIWDPGREGAAAAAELVTGPQREQVPLSFVLNLAYNQAQRDPEAAMPWTSQLAPACQAQARLRVLDAWTSTRPEAAAAWVLQQPAGEGRQDLIASTTRHLLSASSEETARQHGARRRTMFQG